jgi:hypothetical protein
MIIGAMADDNAPAYAKLAAMMNFRMTTKSITVQVMPTKYFL